MMDFRKDFPILETEIYGHPLAYLDNAATTQMPRPVLDCLIRHYESGHANVHRGGYLLSQMATEAMEEARRHVDAFLEPSGNDTFETIFTAGTTDGINRIAAGLRDFVHADDAVIVSSLEHHSNFVPWQQLCMERRAVLKIVPVKKDGCRSGFDMAAYTKMLKDGAKIVAVTQSSNLTGENLPVGEICRLAHENGALTVVDGAQGVRLFRFSELGNDCDFYCFSAHKLFGPCGTGVLYGRKVCLDMLNPTQFGGGMVDQVTPQATSFAGLPHRIEGGTPNFPGIIAFNAALDYIEKVGISYICHTEADLVRYLLEKLKGFPKLVVVGASLKDRLAHPEMYAPLVSFYFPDVNTLDLACFLDRLGIAVRQGNHCAQPAVAAYGAAPAIRVSLAFYNSRGEIDRLVCGLSQALAYFRRWVQ